MKKTVTKISFDLIKELGYSYDFSEDAEDNYRSDTYQNHYIVFNKKNKSFYFYYNDESEEKESISKITTLSEFIYHFTDMIKGMGIEIGKERKINEICDAFEIT